YHRHSQIYTLSLHDALPISQLILPLAASLSKPEQRGKVVGTIMSGLLLGILLSRTLSGFIGQILGWRSMFWIASGICLLIFFFRSEEHTSELQSRFDLVCRL